ncbi:type II toxin-antitoxin system antitoxin DNA ADP-ribosyl glycohydrolase DarG [Treponema endosymbiont of Eucomonympha sp.]|uniref:type II toxin-antitoxin system antitoxin DNA ADP-ribosyl glycohydrolase DarG n=1 Tax=Treponema endosymbiont of Eucomonympha sp. TaxID=1580831 RepID=UPI0007516EC3|nr:macro domain-containing protein [Treponema endosymbiont of Eucomonympha sp.]
MIHYLEGNILESNAQALVNTVNTVGIMGKGIALQFKKAYPDNFTAYSLACKTGKVNIGKLFIKKDSSLINGEKIIINFPTKTDWRKPSEYSYIEKGLIDLVEKIKEYQIKSIALPPLGAGNGGLEWERVKKLIEQKLSVVEDINVYVYEPTTQIKEYLKSERVKLTDARALLLYTLYDLVKNGEYVSEFSSEKVCYFMQRFGAEKYFKLKFDPNFYGPYSGKVRYLLNVLNGSYIMGYSDMNKKPFDPLMLVRDGYEIVSQYIENKSELKVICEQTTSFLNGFYSDFALELLSSIDYIVCKEKSFDEETIFQKLNEWNDRKRTMFSDKKYVKISLRQIQTIGLVP